MYCCCGEYKGIVHMGAGIDIDGPLVAGSSDLDKGSGVLVGNPVAGSAD